MRGTTSSGFRLALALSLCLALSAPATPHQLVVPFFRDDGGDITGGAPILGGAAGFIAVRNTLGEEVTMYLVYSQMDPNGDAVVQQAVPFQLAAFRVVNFRPTKNDPAEGDSLSVPNMLPGLGSEGSLTIIWVGGPEMVSALVGRYHQISVGKDMAHVLLPDSL